MSDVRERGSNPCPIAVNTFVWHSPLTEELLEPTLRTVAQLGYDAVELALENPGDWDAGHAAELLRELGLRSVVGAVFGPGRELAAADPATVASTQDYLRAALRIAVAQGSELVIGPMYTSVGRTWRATPDERRAVVDELRHHLAPVAAEAAELGVRLALEPLNRYETSVINTTEQALDLLEGLPADGIGLNLDTYHMNIEERSVTDALHLAGDRLLHLQVCGNDRGTPVDDHQDWPAIGQALAAIGYEGMLGFESFTADNETIATAASIWRPFAPTQDELARRAQVNLEAWTATWTPAGR